MKCAICKKEAEKYHENICKECWLRPSLIGTHEMMERDKHSRMLFIISFVLLLAGLLLEIFLGKPHWAKVGLWVGFITFPAFYIIVISSYIRAAKHKIRLMLEEGEKKSESQRWYLGPREDMAK